MGLSSYINCADAQGLLSKKGVAYSFAASVLCLIKSVVVNHGCFYALMAGKLLYFVYGSSCQQGKGNGGMSQAVSGQPVAIVPGVYHVGFGNG